MAEDNYQYSFIRRMKKEEEERNKKLLKYQEENDKWLKDHLCSKKDEDYDNNVISNNNTTKKEKKEKKRDVSFLGYPSKTAFCKDNHMDKTTLKKIIEQIRAKDECLNLETILKQKEENIHNCQKYRFKKTINDKKQEIKDNNTKNIPVANGEATSWRVAGGCGFESRQEYHNNNVDKVEKQQEEIKILQNKLEKLEVMFDKLQQNNIKNRNRIKCLDWYFEKKLTKEKNNTELSLDTEINFVRTNYVKGIFHILVLGLLYILTNNIIISILKLIK